MNKRNQDDSSIIITGVTSALGMSAKEHARRGRIHVLILAANPRAMDPLQLDVERREIDAAIRGAEHRDQFDLRSHSAVQVGDLQEHLLRYRPAIVHFSGHGSSRGEIILEDAAGEAHAVPVGALAQLFRAFKNDIRCVVLNACYTASQAQEISLHVGCVVGMSRAIHDVAALRFAVAFYRALAYGQPIRTAFELACVEIRLHDLGEENTPKLLCRNEAASLVTFADSAQVAAEGVTVPHEEPTTRRRRISFSLSIGSVALTISLALAWGVFIEALGPQTSTVDAAIGSSSLDGGVDAASVDAASVDAASPSDGGNDAEEFMPDGTTDSRTLDGRCPDDMTPVARGCARY